MELISLGINRLSELKRYTRDAEVYLAMRADVYYNGMTETEEREAEASINPDFAKK